MKNNTIAATLSLLFLASATGTAQAVDLPRTGQTICYDVAGGVIACAGTGQDGDKLAGVAWPSPRFTDNADGRTDRAHLAQKRELFWQ